MFLKIKFAGNALKIALRHVRSIGDYCQWIAAKTAVGENVIHKILCHNITLIRVVFGFYWMM